MCGCAQVTEWCHAGQNCSTYTCSILWVGEKNIVVAAFSFFFFFSTLQTACITSELFSRNLLSRNSVCMVFHDTMYKRQLLTSLLHVQYFYQLFLTTPFSTSFPSTFSLLSELHTKDVQERQIQLKAKLLLTHISR